jgi:hypothetical protein
MVVIYTFILLIMNEHTLHSYTFWITQFYYKQGHLYESMFIQHYILTNMRSYVVSVIINKQLIIIV